MRDEGHTNLIVVETELVDYIIDIESASTLPGNRFSRLEYPFFVHVVVTDERYGRILCLRPRAD